VSLNPNQSINLGGYVAYKHKNEAVKLS